MNKRIKELAEKCWDQRLDGPHFDQEMFAELIVRECIAVHKDDYGVDIIGDVLKKHFGVKE